MADSERLAHLRSEAKALRQAIEDAEDRLAEWLKINKSEFAAWPIGAEIYQFATGERIGVLAEHRADIDESLFSGTESLVRDDSGMIVGSYLNGIDRRVGTKAERVEWLRKMLKAAERADG